MASYKKITPRRDQVLRLVLADPEGMSARALSKAMGIGQQTVSEHLRKLRDLGHIGPAALGGPEPKWQAIITAAQLRERLREQQRHDKRQRERKAQQMRETAMFLTRPIQRTVRAADCEPIRTRAPASVFHITA